MENGSATHYHLLFGKVYALMLVTSQTYVLHPTKSSLYNFTSIPLLPIIKRIVRLVDESCHGTIQTLIPNAKLYFMEMPRRKEGINVILYTVLARLVE